MLFIGIDPGEKGGIAAISDTGVIDLHHMPGTDKDVANLVGEFGRQVCFALLEHAQSSPVMNPSRAFNYGAGWGVLRGCLASNPLIRWDYIKPQVWQKVMKCMSKGDKNITKDAAQRLFPTQKITHYTADSLLIAEYGRRLWIHLNPKS